ncbi:hypothetical protein [Calidifontibacillus erzurumensis]|uniref:Uncharacterized protein n=1 Tax=Calidifontibacillus erzurumensis TaxID=2741433 RepID=A0A8J8K7T6_9BACI|nr:hypothetical protein [Calidifontibacillus erzurumensis]NSL51066.1 hypothetical protein [Calidifontibacillus erzurumensis]
MKKYVFLFMDKDCPQKCICEQYVEANGMYDAFTKVQKIANNFTKDMHGSLKIELKEVQYFDEQVEMLA